MTASDGLFRPVLAGALLGLALAVLWVGLAPGSILSAAWWRQRRQRPPAGGREFGSRRRDDIIWRRDRR
jgi:hypothetical protein